MAFLEANRYLYLTTPLGDDKLLLHGFKGREAMSQLFSFELDLWAENTTAVDFDKLIGQKVSFGVQGADPAQVPRHFNGIVVEMSQERVTRASLPMTLRSRRKSGSCPSNSAAGFFSTSRSPTS